MPDRRASPPRGGKMKHALHETPPVIRLASQIIAAHGVAEPVFYLGRIWNGQFMGAR